MEQFLEQVNRIHCVPARGYMLKRAVNNVLRDLRGWERQPDNEWTRIQEPNRILVAIPQHVPYGICAAPSTNENIQLHPGMVDASVATSRRTTTPAETECGCMFCTNRRPVLPEAQDVPVINPREEWHPRSSSPEIDANDDAPRTKRSSRSLLAKYPRKD
ncbi:hypothetical protein JTB14_027405 [Gonioctena quinquepunctata]|nr:hypothetical protein JTB14_027405 [Gonioctena quinquepunctata]